MEIPVIFYSVPDTNPHCPPTVFTDRFWDDRERWTNLGVGTVSNSLRIFRGDVPDGTFGVPEGKPEWWITGMDYNVYLADGYSITTDCWSGEEFDPAIEPEGNLLIGGSSISPTDLSGYSEGNIQIGGSASVVDIPSYAVSGGLSIGGSAISPTDLDGYLEGNILIGGSALVVDWETYQPSGNLLIGGSATIAEPPPPVDEDDYPFGNILIGGANLYDGGLDTSDGNLLIGGNIDGPELSSGGLTIGGTDET